MMTKPRIAPLVTFTRWCMNEADRTPCAVDPRLVASLEFFGHAFDAPYGEHFPAATRIIMQNRKEYLVQGTVEEIAACLNNYREESK